MASKILQEDADNAKYADFMYGVATQLSSVLNRLDLP